MVRSEGYTRDCYGTADSVKFSRNTQQQQQNPTFVTTRPTKGSKKKAIRDEDNDNQGFNVRHTNTHTHKKMATRHEKLHGTYISSGVSTEAWITKRRHLRGVAQRKKTILLKYFSRKILT